MFCPRTFIVCPPSLSRFLQEHTRSIHETGAPAVVRIMKISLPVKLDAVEIANFPL